MPVLTLVGDDRYAIQQQLKSFKERLNTNWRDFNYHTYPPANLTDALAAARTPPLGDQQKIIVVENCQFTNVQQFGEKQLEQLTAIAHIPNTTILVFTASTIDKRLKLAKLLTKHGKLQELRLLEPWKTDAIAQSIGSQARDLGLQLTPAQLTYLGQAIGNNTLRAHQELTKLKLYSNGGPLSQAELESLVPCQTQNALQLAEAIRRGESTRVATLLQALLDQAEYPLVITATLITQFRTWLWVKCALTQGIENNQQIAQLCGVGNPGRVYYLRQEVAHASVRALSQALTLLFELDLSLKQGLRPAAMLPVLIAITQRFRSCH